MPIASALRWSVAVEPPAEAAGDAAVAWAIRVGRGLPAGRVAVVERAAGRVIVRRGAPLLGRRGFDPTAAEVGDQRQAGGRRFLGPGLRCDSNVRSPRPSGFWLMGHGWYLERDAGGTWLGLTGGTWAASRRLLAVGFLRRGVDAIGRGATTPATVSDDGQQPGRFEPR